MAVGDAACVAAMEEAAMEEAAYVHIHARSPVKMSWETHYVGNLRAINMLPIDNYQLKSQDVMHMPSPVGLTADTTVVTKEMIDYFFA